MAFSCGAGGRAAFFVLDQGEAEVVAVVAEVRWSPTLSAMRLREGWGEVLGMIGRATPARRPSPAWP